MDKSAEAMTKYSKPLEVRRGRSKIIAAILAIFFGDLGFHKFYLGQAGWGIVYFVFSWTFIPWFLGIVEGIIYLSMSDKSFEKKYT